MAVKIRLKRMGMKKHPFYRVVVADMRSPRDGRFIEEIGYYNPMTVVKDEHGVGIPNDKGSDKTHAPAQIKIDGERAKYWLGVGAQPTETVRVLLKKAGVIEQ